MFNFILNWDWKLKLKKFSWNGKFSKNEKLSAGKCWIKCSSLLKWKHLIKSIWPLKQHQFELLLQTSELTLQVPCAPCLPGAKLFGWVPDPMVLLPWVRQRGKRVTKAGGVPGSPAFWERGGHELQLPADTGGIQTDMDWRFSDKNYVSSLSNRNKHQDIKKSNLFFIKSIKFCTKKSPQLYRFFFFTPKLLLE